MPSPHFKRISWKRVFMEGERRIKAYFTIALLRASPRERASLLAKREAVTHRILRASKEHSPQLLKRAVREQMHFLLQLIDVMKRQEKD